MKIENKIYENSTRKTEKTHTKWIWMKNVENDHHIHE